MNSKLMKQLTCLYFINSIFKLSRSEEHTSELQSQSNLVCRLLLEKKKTTLHLRVQSPLLAIGSKPAGVGLAEVSDIEVCARHAHTPQNKALQRYQSLGATSHVYIL